ncbi:sensor histidine kinase [Flexivirga sp. ID2601S]|uniref:histidine kinase n=1 Tax=Flexivirga aerilata TaxID=1656889 RepID=A0A849AQM2_9MICO|nr:sensor histidine kinase [Flexivirga aerilata]NNG40590.1 sensor histidine kinase [Flexivirga aerilata]
MPTRYDFALVAALIVGTVVPYAGHDHPVWVLACGAGQIVPLLWRRIAPVPTFAAVAIASAASVPVLNVVTISDIGIFIALFAVVSRRGWRPWGIAATAVCVLGAGIAAVRWSSDIEGARGAQVVFIFGVNLLAVIATLGIAEASRRRAQLIEQLHARARDAEHERDQQAVIVAQAERARIAREMHDVVAHALAVIVVQADGAGHAISRRSAPDPTAAQALSTIGDTARTALAETRALVGVLRDGGGDGLAELAPTHDLTALPSLVDGVRATGRTVLLDEGSVRPEDVSPGVSRAAYRIVQEATTNVLKHAGDEARIWIRLRRRDELLVLEIEDDGVGATDASTGGNGLLGMRERVHAFGGQLWTSPRPGGGFRVAAEFPTEGER